MTGRNRDRSLFVVKTTHGFEEKKRLSWALLVLSFGLGALGCGLDATDPDPGKTTVCGNGVIDPGEDCDLRSKDTQGKLVDTPIFKIAICGQGELICLPNCTLKPGACKTYCGDGEVNGKEECDGDDFAVECVDGKFMCRADCTLDKSQCHAYCGDGVITPPKEHCEPGMVPKGVCYDGTVTCKKDCTLDLLSCNQFCGDEVQNGPEPCDGPQIGSSCHNASGVLSCSEACTIKTNGCDAYCGDGKVNGFEECDKDDFKGSKPCAAATCGVDCIVDDTACS